MLTTPPSCEHEFVAIPIEDHEFVQRCEWCGTLEPCSDEQLQWFLGNCKFVRSLYNWEKVKAKTKASEKAFWRGLEIKDAQIDWLQREIEKRAK